MPNPLVIHATPPFSPLPASDIDSIYIAAVAQLQCPGRWAMVTASYGDNRGDLPFVTHQDHQIKLGHLHSLPSLPHPNVDLSEKERAEALSWVAYIDGKVTDLINHTLYSLPRNYPEKVAPAQTAFLSFPQSVYIPQRLRAMYKSRLQDVGLWGLGGMNETDLAEEDRKRLEEVYVQAPGGTVAPRAWSGWRAGREFEEARKKRGEEELLRIVEDIFAVLDRRLGNKPYFFSNRPTTPDLRLFAHLSLILDTDLPNPLLANHLREHHPNLVSHQDRIKWLLFGPDSWGMITVSPSNSSSWTLNGLAASSYSKITSFFTRPASVDPEKKQDVALRKGRWLWYAGAFGAMVTYVFASGLLQIEFVEEEIDEDESDVKGIEE